MRCCVGAFSTPRSSFVGFVDFCVRLVCREGLCSCEPGSVNRCVVSCGLFSSVVEPYLLVEPVPPRDVCAEFGRSVSPYGRLWVVLALVHDTSAVIPCCSSQDSGVCCCPLYRRFCPGGCDWFWCIRLCGEWQRCLGVDPPVSCFCAQCGTLVWTWA